VSGAAPVELTIAVSPLRHHQALLDGTVTIPGVELRPVPPAGEYAARFKEMCRDLAYDVCELSVMSYYTARQYGLPISAIPVVPTHRFHHRDFLKNVHAGIESPLDLAGKRVGTRTYTVTPGVLDRGILSQEFGLDLDTVTWVLAEEEHVAEVANHYPPNVVPGRNENLFPRLASGDLDAGIAGSNLRGQQSPDVVPLFPNAAELDRAQYQRNGIVPAFTLIAVKTAVLDERPWLTEALYDAFVAARGRGLEPDRDVAQIVDGDPVPVGLAANRASFEELLALGREQHILDGAGTVDDLFPPLG
jgi:4,5-dihydroxyphthalate decarboxylase